MKLSLRTFVPNTDTSLSDSLLDDYVFQNFDKMTPADYDFIGFRSGLEIHQQLLTSKKLFCRCPAGEYSDEYHAEILRHMRPTLSELGEYDGTALMEFKTRKEIIYHINRNTVCTYEMDDTPPFELNEEALDIALEIGLLYGCSLVDELHISRKQYLDGSIPTGFQRTTIVGVNGSIPYKNRLIPIVQLGLEEDACREVSDYGHTRVYLTDRLGMPLIETVTAPEMRSPQEVAEVNEIFRRLVRSTGKVRTGIGSTRQDVNVSILGGTRIEIKGVPRIPMIPLLTYNEAQRQWNLLRLRRELHRRGITPQTFSYHFDDVTRLLRKTRYTPIRNAIHENKTVQCVVLHQFKGLLRWPTQTDTYFSREISDRVRVIACLTTLPNLIHSDSPSETLSTAEWQSVRKQTNSSNDDTLVLVWGDTKDVETAVQEIVIRALEATMGVPSETRQALSDGTNGFERILPGPDRMYPDTDLPPKKITKDRIERIARLVPEPYWKREEWCKTLNIPSDTLKPLTISPYYSIFEKAVKDWKLNPTTVAVSLIQYPKRLKRKCLSLSNLHRDAIEAILLLYRDGRISKEGIYIMMESVCENGTLEVDFEEEDYLSLLPNEIEKCFQDCKHLPFHHYEQMFRTLMRSVMNRFRGKIDGAIVAEQVHFYLKTLSV
ncbi:MAG: Glu-tRNA(Gln) amidotransferase subunit GatE [bacterium]|nr:Glu-tRNA(Gln) amidotransferase subunit GatE [bacterium]